MRVLAVGATGWRTCDGHHCLAQATTSQLAVDQHGSEPPKEYAMSPHTNLACLVAILATFAPAPAHAQFEGAGDHMTQFTPMMEQFDPMMQMLKGRMSKKRMAEMMQMIAPMMSSVMAPGGANFISMPGMEGMSMMGDGPTRRAHRRHK
jgi:hypothetical protein